MPSVPLTRRRFTLKRKRYQAGSLHRKTRAKGPDVWVLRYREAQQDGTTAQRSIIVGTVHQYSTKTKAQKAAEGLRLTLNNDYVPTDTAIMVQDESVGFVQGAAFRPGNHCALRTLVPQIQTELSGRP
jgi:hypothetical protein